MGRSLWILVSVMLVMTMAAPAMADPGWLLLPADDLAEEPGARAADMAVYRADDGTRISAPGLSGAWEAGAPVELDPGWYLVDVGTERSFANLRRLQVVSGFVTIVPTGWLSVRTLPTSRQPTQGCAGWNAELSVYVDDGEGGTTRVATNRESGVREFGAIQLAAGTYRVIFNGIPTQIEVLAGYDVRLPVGWQDPVAGGQPQLAVADGMLPGDARVALCADGSIHVPAGEYLAAGITQIPEYPYERRDWVRVVVTPDDARDPERLAGPRTDAPVWTGEGSEGERVPTDDPIVSTLREQGTRSGPRFEGFGR